jgi:S-adenosylmethionine synthetase
MVGYATSETESFLPREYELAQQLCKKLYQQFPFDGKVQVTIDGTEATSVVASFQNVSTEVLRKAVDNFLALQADLWSDKDSVERGGRSTATLEGQNPFRVVPSKVLINPAGDWNLGGFDADSGLSGRKIIIDNYGPNIPVGGGSFSGKDATKVDRSAAYMARFAAKNIVAQGLAKECLIKVAYSIGVVEPVMLVATNENGEDISDLVRSMFDFRPQAIIERLDLRRPIYSQTAKSGHFGHWEMAWEQLINL